MEELKCTKELVKEFQKAGGVGERLQRSLEMKARNTDNWVSSTTKSIAVGTLGLRNIMAQLADFSYHFCTFSFFCVSFYDIKIPCEMIKIRVKEDEVTWHVKDMAFYDTRWFSPNLLPVRENS